VRKRTMDIRVPGPFVPSIDESTIGDEAVSAVRNPSLAWAIHKQKMPSGGQLFEGWGLGVLRARAAISETGGMLKYRSNSFCVEALITAGGTPANTERKSPIIPGVL